MPDIDTQEPGNATLAGTRERPFARHRPLEPLWRLDPTRQVIYLGSFSKTLAPSLRIGFLIAPHPDIAELTHARVLIDVQPPHLTQAALAHLIGLPLESWRVA